MSTRNKQLIAARAKQFIEGAKQHFTKSTLLVAGQKWSGEDIETFLTKRIDAIHNVDIARAALDKAIAIERASTDDSQAASSALVQAVKAAFFADSDVLAQFGLSPNKAPRRLTNEERTAAIGKGQATRALRHTMGTRQKAKIKAAAPNVSHDVTPTATAIAPTPVAATANSASTPTPASSTTTSMTPTSTNAA